MKTKQSLKLQKKEFDSSKSYSGKLILRFSPIAHEQVARIAYSKNMSINLLLNIMIDEGIKKERNREKRKNSSIEETRGD